MWSLSARRAWIEIVVNSLGYSGGWGSLSARRAWIEMAIASSVADRSAVALRKESVDRNMTCPPRGTVSRNVALRKESVDRNIDILHDVLANCCRSPQGERG